MQVDHAKPKTKVQAEQVQWVFGGPQAPSVVHANIDFGSRQPPVHQITILELCLPLYLVYDS
jgi:hypothetical protein